MCLAAIALGPRPRFPWVLWANRDEFFAREAQPLGWWTPQEGAPQILGGRDLSAGGTWLGIHPAGRLALVTNVRDPGRALQASPSRGALVGQWLAGPGDLASLRRLADVGRNGFNLLAADLRATPSPAGEAGGAWWTSNRPQPTLSALRTGVHGLSNASLDTPWPKLLVLKRRLAQAVQQADDLPSLVAAGLQALADRAPAPDHLLPDTGLPRDRERQLSPAFVHIAGQTPAQDYGTRCSTVVVVEDVGAQRLVHVVERSFDRRGEPAGDVAVTFPLAPTPAAASANTPGAP